MTKQRPALPRSLAKKRQLKKADTEVLNQPDSLAALAWHRRDAERRLCLRVVALDFLGIDNDQPNWRERYIDWLEGQVFPAFQLKGSAGRHPEKLELDRILILTRLEFSRDDDGNRLQVKSAALLLAREHLGPAADAKKVEETAKKFIEVRNRYWRDRRERLGNASHPNAAN